MGNMVFCKGLVPYFGGKFKFAFGYGIIQNIICGIQDMTDKYFEAPYEEYPITYVVRRLSSSVGNLPLLKQRILRKQKYS